MSAYHGDWLLDHHERIQDGGWHAIFQGDVLTVSHRRPRWIPKGRGVRGVVRSFSRASRLRMLKATGKIAFSKIPYSLFITLTYPDNNVKTNNAMRNTERYLFHRKMEKHLGRKVSLIWRCEWKRRKTGKYRGKPVAHIHLLIFNVRFIAKETVRAWWRGIIQAEGPLCTDVKRVENKRKANNYIAKYTAKSDEVGTLECVSYLNTTGRQWGMLRKDLIPFATPYNLPFIDEKTVEWLREQATSILGWYDPYFDEGFTILGFHAELVGYILLEKVLDNWTASWSNSS